MNRRKPREFTWLEQSGGRKIRGAGQVTEAGVSLFPAGRKKKIPELVHHWMSQEKKRTHKRERREGKADGQDAG